MQLVPCVHCRRHVAVGETACPFCASALPHRTAQSIFVARLTRAAIFSAGAVTAACGDKETKPAPAPATQPGSGSGSAPADDDLERMLDVDQRVVDHGAPVDAAAPDAASLAASAVDAGLPVDAGVDPQVAERRRKEAAERERKRKREQELERQRQLEIERMRWENQQAKPYGAPPARRRVV